MPNGKTKGKGVNNTEPTPKQKLAFKLLTENLSKNPKTVKKKEIMRQAGYSENIAKQPNIVTQSKGWQQLMDKYLSENELAKQHSGILTRKYTKDADRLAAIRLGYQVRGKLDNNKLPEMDGNSELTIAIMRLRKILPQ
jgi:hypothetical protein